MNSTAINVAVTESKSEDAESEVSYEAYTAFVSKAVITDILRLLIDEEMLEKCSLDELTAIFKHFGVDEYDEAVTALVRSKYSADKVEAILCNRGDGSEEHQEEYDKFQEWRTYSKQLAAKLFTE